MQYITCVSDVEKSYIANSVLQQLPSSIVTVASFWASILSSVATKQKLHSGKDSWWLCITHIAYMYLVLPWIEILKVNCYCNSRFYRSHSVHRYDSISWFWNRFSDSVIINCQLCINLSHSYCTMQSFTIIIFFYFTGKWYEWMTFPSWVDGDCLRAQR